mgnify:CR=1 FL=1
MAAKNFAIVPPSCSSPASPYKIPHPTLPPRCILALVLAGLANPLRSGQWFFRLAFFLPFVLSSAAIALIWVFIITPDTGLLNLVQGGIGMTPSAVLADPNWAMWGVAGATVWWTSGINFVLYTPGRQELPSEGYRVTRSHGPPTGRQVRYPPKPLLG